MVELPAWLTNDDVGGQVSLFPFEYFEACVGIDFPFVVMDFRTDAAHPPYCSGITDKIGKAQSHQGRSPGNDGNQSQADEEECPKKSPTLPVAHERVSKLIELPGRRLRRFDRDWRSE